METSREGATVRQGEQRLLRVREVADTLAVSTMTVYRLIHDGQLAAIRVGHGWRIPAANLDTYLDQGREA